MKGTRVPAFWRWNGVLPPGRDIDALAAQITFRHSSTSPGPRIPDKIQDRDGRSLLPLLQNSRAKWPDRFFFFHTGRWKKGADPDQSKNKNFAVRSERFRLIDGKELYDIDADPGETTNVIAKHPEVAKTMRAAYDSWWKETRPLMVNEEVPNSKEQPFAVLYEKQARSGSIPTWEVPNLK